MAAYYNRMQIRLAHLLTALLACNAALAQQEISVVQQERLAMPATGAHRLVPTLVLLEGSGWTRERALGALREAAAILAQCDIGIVGVEWVRLSAPARYLDFSTPAAREVARLHPVPRPAIYLVRDTRSRPAFDAEAIGRGNSRTRPELADTVWMTAATRDPGVALAHELAHVLMDNGDHSDEPGNLMRDETSAANTALSVTQCTRLRETALANGLLQR
jgi:hypothetical protein